MLQGPAATTNNSGLFDTISEQRRGLDQLIGLKGESRCAVHQAVERRRRVDGEDVYIVEEKSGDRDGDALEGDHTFDKSRSHTQNSTFTGRQSVYSDENQANATAGRSMPTFSRCFHSFGSCRYSISTRWSACDVSR